MLHKIDLHKCLVVVILILVFATAAGRGRVRRGGAIPVFRKTPDGNFVWNGSFIDSVPEIASRVRVSPFDKPSTRKLVGRKRRPGRDLLRFYSGVDTVKVMLFRVAFLSDRKDKLSSINTGGDFDLTSPDTTSIIDPAPHNRDYFDSHMKGLRNYYHFQSCGKLEIIWDVLPRGQNESYKLSDIADYGPGESEVWTTGRIVDFLHDCVMAADAELAEQGYPVSFGDYDAIIMAHAGANMQSDVDYDTPNDFPSLYARLGTEDEIIVDGGRTVLREISAIPETASQDGYIGGIAAVLAHEFGHALGLPDLYNIYTNGSAIGGWGNMDSGGQLPVYLQDRNGKVYYVEGLIPSGHCAWCREYLGWLDIRTVDTFDNSISLPAVEKCPARAIKVEAAADEYFLIENRAAELDDSLTYFLADSNGVVVGMGNSRSSLVNGYDIILPTEDVEEISHRSGPGILVWHIDRGLIEQRWEANEVNSLTPLAVSMLEANGVVDLGDPSSPYGLGWWDDAYFAGNNTTLSDSTLPSSWSNWNVPTGVRVENISVRDTLMHFGAGIRAVRHSAEMVEDIEAVPGSPLPLQESFSGLVVDEDGRGWVTGADTAVFNLADSIIFPMAHHHRFGGGQGAIAVAEKSGLVHLYRKSGGEYSGWPVELGSVPVSAPVIFSAGDNYYLAVADHDGYLHVFNREGEEMAGLPIYMNRILSNLVVSRDSTGEAEWLYFLFEQQEGERIWLTRFKINASLSVFLERYGGADYPVDLSRSEIEGRIALLGGDIDPNLEGDEIYVVSFESGKIMLYGRGGMIAGRNREKKIEYFPALQDLDGNTFLDLIYTDGHTIYAISPSGANIEGWPRTLGEYYRLPAQTEISASLTAISWEGGARVFAGTGDGLLFVYNGRGELVEGFPRRVCSAFYAAPDLMGSDGEGLFSYYDGGGFRWRRINMETGWMERGWVAEMADPSRCSYVLPSEGWKPRDVSRWVALDDNFIVYPNPSYGEMVNFKFASPGEGEARLEILTVSGELVVEKNKPLNGGETDEFSVRLSEQAGGVYLSRLTVFSNGRKSEAYRKFAIVR